MVWTRSGNQHLLLSGRRWFMAREVSVIGLDIAKSVFQIHGADRQGRAVQSLEETEWLLSIAES